eukprot:13055889-Ditylum_brightwellii.AAC.1
MMTLAVNIGLYFWQVDHSNTFIQTHLPENEEVYMAFPHGREHHGNVLRLTKLVYGLSQVPLHWFNTLSDGSEKARFKPSNLDPCLFLSDTVICIVCVDDCLMFACDPQEITKKIDCMTEQGFELQVEDDAAGFLGIDLKHQDDGTLELKQTALIQCNIGAIGFQHASSCSTPAEMVELLADKDGPGP